VNACQASALNDNVPPSRLVVAIEILLADPEALGDVLESCLYILREKLRAP
jgi:hypothetical protein